MIEDALANAMLDAYLTDGTKYLSVLDESGAEISGVTRVTVSTWAAASSRAKTMATFSSNITVPAGGGGNVVAYLGLYTAPSGGTLLAKLPANSTVKGVATALASSDVLTSYAHGLADDNRVVVSAVHGEAIPAGLTAGTLYYVVGATTDTFQLSTTSGGAAVNITTSGELRFERLVLQAFPTGGVVAPQTSSAISLAG
jgi:hypothetical protein